MVDDAIRMKGDADNTSENVDRFFRACGSCAWSASLSSWVAILVTSSFNTPKPIIRAMPLSLSDFYSRSGEEGGLPATATNLYYANSWLGLQAFVKLII